MFERFKPQISSSDLVCLRFQSNLSHVTHPERGVRVCVGVNVAVCDVSYVCCVCARPANQIASSATELAMLVQSTRRAVRLRLGLSSLLKNITISETSGRGIVCLTFFNRHVYLL